MSVQSDAPGHWQVDPADPSVGLMRPDIYHECDDPDALTSEGPDGVFTCTCGAWIDFNPDC